MNVFVTGGTGFIGSHLIHNLKERNNIVVLIRDLPSGLWSKWLNTALHGCTIVQGGLAKCQSARVLRRILAEYNIEHVYHLAAQAIVSTALKDPTGTFETNIMGTVNLLEACREIKVAKILVMSTDKTYGDLMGAKESDPLVSSGVYETSKSCEDFVAQCFRKTYDMNIVVARSCNCYGYDLNRRIIPNTIKACIRGDPPIIFQGEDSIRQYIYVEDLVSALSFLMRTCKGPGIFNVATDDVLTQEQVVKRICKFFPMNPRYVKREKPLKELKAQSLDWSKIGEWGWKPKFRFEEAIKETIRRFERYGTS